MFSYQTYTNICLSGLEKKNSGVTYTNICFSGVTSVNTCSHIKPTQLSVYLVVYKNLFLRCDLHKYLFLSASLSSKVLLTRQTTGKTKFLPLNLFKKTNPTIKQCYVSVVCEVHVWDVCQTLLRNHWLWRY